MKKFEYKITYNIETEEEMNLLGSEGWELVSFNSVNNKAVFKREIQKTTANYGIKNPSSKLNEQKVIEIRLKSKMDGLSTYKLSNMYNVSPQTIRDVINNITWKDISPKNL